MLCQICWMCSFLWEFVASIGNYPCELQIVLRHLMFRSSDTLSSCWNSLFRCFFILSFDSKTPFDSVVVGSVAVLPCLVIESIACAMYWQKRDRPSSTTRSDNVENFFQDSSRSVTLLHLRDALSRRLSVAARLTIIYRMPISQFSPINLIYPQLRPSHTPVKQPFLPHPLFDHWTYNIDYF